MPTVPQPRTARKVERYVRLTSPPAGRIPGELVITLDGKPTVYGITCHSVPPEVGDRAFSLTKPDGTVYDVLLNDFDSTCECLGFLRYGRPCKHISATQALVDAKRL